MNLQNDPNSWAVAKFAIGQPVLRSEDPKLVRGQGRFTDDVSLPGEAHAVIVRSRHPHGIIRAIDTAAARAMPGVLGVYTGADLVAAGYGTLRCIVPFNNRDGSPMKKPPRNALPTDKVRFVGDPVACVVAETLWQAKDAAEAVEVEIEPLPAVTNPEEAVRPGAPILYDEAPDNVALDYHYGDSDQVAAAFAKAAHVTRIKLTNRWSRARRSPPTRTAGSRSTCPRRARSGCAATSPRCSGSSRSRCACSPAMSAARSA